MGHNSVVEHDWTSCVGLAKTQTDVQNLIAWQKSQNGHLSRIETRITGLLVGIILTLLAILAQVILKVWGVL